jgi:hypothetical protein
MLNDNGGLAINGGRMALPYAIFFRKGLTPAIVPELLEFLIAQIRGQNAAHDQFTKAS